ncbi:MAG: helix-turn-helix domain-containing protein, partial [Bilophila sp.]
AFMLTEDNVIKPHNLSFSPRNLSPSAQNPASSPENVSATSAPCSPQGTHASGLPAPRHHAPEKTPEQGAASPPAQSSPNSQSSPQAKCSDPPELKAPTDLAVPAARPITFSALHTDQAEKERQLILEVLALCRYNCTKTAARLGIHRTTLYTKMATLGINILEVRSPA